MFASDSTRRAVVVQNLLFVALLLALVLLLGYLAREHRAQWDVTRNARHSLSQASLDILARLSGPVTVTAYATPHDPQLGDLRQMIRDFVGPYQRAKPDLTLTFVDPTEQPKEAQAAGIETNGEMVVRYQGRSEHLTVLGEQALTNLLMRLAREGERLVMYLDGHGERKLDGAANHDLGQFGRQLRAKGLQIAPLNLTVAQDVPANASLLVIAAPRVDLLEGETEKILAFLERGGSLLWLADPEPLRGLQPLAEKLGLTLTPGTVLDPAAEELSLPIAWALGANYGNHAAIRGFNLITVFPHARQVVAEEGQEWRNAVLVESSDRSWVESDSLGRPAFDRNRDTPGPVTLAVAMSRSRRDHEQRVVVVGNGAFLSNAYLGNGGNLDLGVNLVNWLAGDERLITLQPRPVVDSGLALTRNAALVITLGLLIAAPLAFLAAGGWTWWRRRKL
ncbi:MAG TPA: GldG family protein [Burkholderiales bacterium]